jgi:hypothetical protein
MQVGSPNYCGREKAISIAYSECVCVALVIQEAKHMRRIIFSPVSSLWFYHYFPKLSHERNDFRENVTEHKMFVLLFPYKFCLKHFSFHEIFKDVINVQTPSCKVTVILVRL